MRHANHWMQRALPRIMPVRGIVRYLGKSDIVMSDADIIGLYNIVVKTPSSGRRV
jgi:hypothetical protein